MDLLAFDLNSLKEFRLLKGSFLNLQRAVFRNRIVILHSLLNQGVLRLFDGVVLGIVSFAIAINVSVKCFIKTLLLRC